MERITENNEGNGTEEHIMTSAIRFRGEIYTGQGHIFALERIMAEHPDCLECEDEMESGFLTSLDRFVSREEAERLTKAGNSEA